MTQCPCGRAAFSTCGRCCSGCGKGYHTVPCALQQVTAGATVVVSAGRWDFDLTTIPFAKKEIAL